MMNRLILKNLIIIAFFLSLLLPISPSQAEDPWDSYKGWSGVETLSNQPSWYLVIRKKGEQIVNQDNVFLKWYKYENNTTNMRPNHWKSSFILIDGNTLLKANNPQENDWQASLIDLPKVGIA